MFLAQNDYFKQNTLMVTSAQLALSVVWGGFTKIRRHPSQGDNDANGGSSHASHIRCVACLKLLLFG